MLRRKSLYSVLNDVISFKLEDPLHEDIPLGQPRSKVIPALRTVCKTSFAVTADHVVALLAAVDAGGGQLQTDGALELIPQPRVGPACCWLLPWPRSRRISHGPL